MPTSSPIVSIRRKITLAVLCTFGASACGGTEQDVLSAYQANDTESRTFQISMGQAWNAAHAALLWNDADSVVEHSTERCMIGIAGFTPWSYGHAMGVWIEPVRPDVTRIRVVVSRALATTVSAPSESSLLNDIERALILEKRGLPLPDSDPD